MTDDQKDSLLNVVDYVIDALKREFEPVVQAYSRARGDNMVDAFEDQRLGPLVEFNTAEALIEVSRSLDRIADAIAGKKPKFEVDKPEKDMDPLGLLPKKGGRRWN